MQAKIVFEGKTKAGIPYSIRYPATDDAPAMQAYLNALSQEQTFIRFQGEQVSLEDEEKFLETQLEKIASKKAIMLFVTSDERIVGTGEINLKDKSERHEGVFAIFLQKEYRGEGIGKQFMNCLIQEAIATIPQLKLITLEVFAHNTLALEMYKNFGFTEYGRLPKGSTHRGKYVDRVYMYKQVRDIA
jgi:RimJ/RimL family protein N-acetyltransferase